MRRFLANSSSNSVWSYEGVRHSSREEYKRAAHSIDWMLFRVVGVAHPEQFINRPILVSIDRVEYGLSCQIAVSCANDTETKFVARTKRLGRSPGISLEERRPGGLRRALQPVERRSVVLERDQRQAANL